MKERHESPQGPTPAQRGRAVRKDRPGRDDGGIAPKRSAGSKVHHRSAARQGKGVRSAVNGSGGRHTSSDVRSRDARRRSVAARRRRLAARRRARILRIALVAALFVGLILIAARLSAPALREITAALDPTPSPTVEPTPSPSPTPSPVPTPSPTPSPTPHPTILIADAYPTDMHKLDGIPQTDGPLGLPEGERVEDSFFNGAVFVGDSVTMKLRNYVVQQRRGDHPKMLGNAKFLVEGGLGSHNLVAPVTKSSLHPTIGGKKMTLEDALEKLNAKKVFIMLGANDVYSTGLDKSVANMGTLIRRIHEKLPDVQIFIESATPRFNERGPNSNSLFKYNCALYKEMAELQLEGVYFVDVAYVMRGDDGRLIKAYCSDADGMGLHFTDKGCQEWLKYLYTHTPLT